MCSTRTMATSTDPRRAETEYFNGYERGRDACLTKGADTAKRWLRRNAVTGPFRTGYAGALWDWEDSNGLPHDPVESVS